MINDLFCVVVAMEICAQRLLAFRNAFTSSAHVLDIDLAKITLMKWMVPNNRGGRTTFVTSLGNPTDDLRGRLLGRDRQFIGWSPCAFCCRQMYAARVSIPFCWKRGRRSPSVCCLEEWSTEFWLKPPGRQIVFLEKKSRLKVQRKVDRKRGHKLKWLGFNESCWGLKLAIECYGVVQLSSQCVVMGLTEIE